MPVTIEEINVSLTSQVTIRVDGTELQEPVMAKLAHMTVEQDAHLPGMFRLTFLDPGLELINSGPFALAKEVTIAAQGIEDDFITLIKGDITAIEPSFGNDMIARLVVRGYDRSHRLLRETHTRAFLNTKDSDLAQQIAGDAGLESQIDTTQMVYEHVFQHNQTDLAFLTERAWRIGFECFVQEGKLFFRRPPADGNAIQIAWGGALMSFHPRMTLAEQVDEVVVRGWDMRQQQAIVGRAQNGGLYPQIGEQQNGAQLAQQGFGAGRRVIVDQPVTSQEEANALASARLDEISGAFVQADGEVFRRPDVQVGRIVDLQGVGERFSGRYLVTAAEHVYEPGGLRTRFSVRGLRTGLLADQFSGQAPVERWPGVVIAVVTNNEDPNALGRVKVKFPWMSDDAESNWARVLGMGASALKGIAALPSVGDEVLVAFEHGQFDHPYILGGLWNGQNGIPSQISTADDNEKHMVMTWNTLLQHHITMYDNADDKIEIVSRAGRSITLSDADNKITIHTQGVDLVIDDSKVSIRTQGDVSIEANGSMSLRAQANMEIRASGQVNINGSMINLNS